MMNTFRKGLLHGAGFSVDKLAMALLDLLALYLAGGTGQMDIRNVRNAHQPQRPLWRAGLFGRRRHARIAQTDCQSVGHQLDDATLAARRAK